jgi:hypothetical protein
MTFPNLKKISGHCHIVADDKEVQVMFEELFESLTGPVGLGVMLLLAFPGGRQVARGTVKAVIRTGTEVADYFKEIREEVEQERKFYGTTQLSDKARAR